MTKLGLSGVMAGTVGAHAVGGAPDALKSAVDTTQTAARATGRGLQAVGEKGADIGAAVGGAAGALKGGATTGYFAMKAGERGGRILAKPVTALGERMAKIGLSPDEAIVDTHETLTKKADKNFEKAQQELSIYDASLRHEPIDEDANPAYKAAKAKFDKAQAAQAEAHYHLNEARDVLRENLEKQSAGRSEREITPQEAALARPEAPTPTKEENDAKLARLMEQAAPAEKPALAPENVKVPGQVQPETFPQEPTAAPRVDETTQMRPLGDNKGVIMGRPPRLLTEGVPEAAAAPEAPKGEILPPEKPVKPGRLGALKVGEGGKVIDTEDEMQRKIEEGLQGTPKPVAMRPLGAPEETKAPLGGKIEVGEPKVEPTPAEPAKPVEETKPVEKPAAELTEENRRALEHRLGKTNIDLLDSPEGVEAARRFIRGTNKQYADLANTFKIDGGSGENGTWKPEDFKRSRAEHGGELSPKKEAIINELRKYLPEHADLMEATKEWGPDVASYGAPAGGVDNAHEAAVKEGGGEYKGVQEGVPEAGLKGLVLFDHPETHSSLALPEDEVTPEAVRAKLEAHKEAWDKAKEKPEEGTFAPVDKAEYFKAVKDSPSAATLTAPEDMEKNRAYKSPEGVYYSIDPKGDIQAVVNNSPSVWNLVSAIQDAVSKGGKTLDAWDLVLPKFYESIGFENTDHV